MQSGVARNVVHYVLLDAVVNQVFHKHILIAFAWHNLRGFVVYLMILAMHYFGCICTFVHTRAYLDKKSRVDICSAITGLYFCSS